MSANIRSPGDLLRAFAANEHLDIAAGYVAAGRRYAGLSDGVLERTWASAYVGYYLKGQRHRWADCRDAQGELTLRGLPRPMRLIPAKARKRIAARMSKFMCRPEVTRDLQAQLQDFLRRRREPAN
jgi:hypothetical protein